MATLAVNKTDVQKFAASATDDQVDALLEGTLATARRLAPCLKADVTTLTDDQAAEAKDIIVGVVLRRLEVGAGTTTNLIAGPYQEVQAQPSQDPRRSSKFTPGEVRDLQAICSVQKGGAFTITLGYDATDALAEDWTPADA